MFENLGKSNNKKARNFIVANISEDMWFETLRTGKYTIIPETVEVDDLIGLELVSCLKNRGLVGTLRKIGINAESQVTNINMEPGDSLYVISAGGFCLRDYKEADELPSFVHLRAIRYSFKEK